MLFTLNKSNFVTSFSKINVNVNGENITGEKGETIRDLLIKNNIQVPSLCGGHQTCNLCKVLVDNELKLACSTQIKDGMTISTKSENIKKDVLQQMHKFQSTPNVDNAIKTVENDKYKPTYIDNTTNSIQVDYSKCIDCGSCIRTCGSDVLIKDGHVQPSGGFGLKAAGCTACGKCVENCPAKAITYTNNIHFYKEALSEKKTAKVGVLDMSILYELEDEFKLPIGSVSLNDILCLLKNLGFDYFLDSTLLCDYDIINDAARINRNRSKGLSLTIGSFCQSLLKKILRVDPIGSDQVARVFLGPETHFTTFVVSGCYAKRGSSTNIIGSPYKYSSVGISPEEFFELIREKCGTKSIETLFNGSPCEALPLGSREGVRADCAERFTDSVIRTYCKNYLGVDIQPLHFNKIHKTIEIANFNIFEGQKLVAAVADRRKGFDLLIKKNISNLMFISPRECPPPPGPDLILERKDVEAETRKIKLAYDNEAVQQIWKSIKRKEF